MTAQIALSVLLCGVLLYAGNERRRSPVVAWLSIVAAVSGLYFTWMPAHATLLAHWIGIGRGVDLVLYIWVCITLIVLLNLHLKLRTQMELVTALARTIACSCPKTSGDRCSTPIRRSSDPLSWALVLGLLGMTVLVATWRPAQEAAQVDPVLLLRDE